MLQILREIEPDEVYNLAGQTSVGRSFADPLGTMESIVSGTTHLLEAVRLSASPIRVYQASSSECFGNTGVNGADELTSFSPRSPYAVAKVAAHFAVANYREAYGLHACSGFLFNHESSRRSSEFVTRKVIKSACEIFANGSGKLELGTLSVSRDWGYAPEYVIAMWQMLQMDQPQDFVIATGEANTLERFVSVTFELLGLDWRDYVRTTTAYRRPTDIVFSKGNPDKAAELLGWTANYRMRETIGILLREQLNALGCAIPASLPSPQSPVRAQPVLAKRADRPLHSKSVSPSD